MYETLFTLFLVPLQNIRKCEVFEGEQKRIKKISVPFLEKLQSGVKNVEEIRTLSFPLTMDPNGSNNWLLCKIHFVPMLPCTPMLYGFYIISIPLQNVRK